MTTNQPAPKHVMEACRAYNQGEELIGRRIRSWDFQPMEGRADRYVEGTVTGVSSDGRLIVDVLLDSIPEREHAREGQTIYTPIYGHSFMNDPAFERIEVLDGEVADRAGHDLCRELNANRSADEDGEHDGEYRLETGYRCNANGVHFSIARVAFVRYANREGVPNATVSDAGTGIPLVAYGRDDDEALAALDQLVAAVTLSAEEG